MSEGQGEGVPEVVPSIPAEPLPPPPPEDTRISPIAVALITMALAMVAYLVLSTVGSFINLAFGVALTQAGLLAALVIVLRLSRRSVTRFTGLVGSRPRAYLLGAAIGLGNALLFTGPLQLLSRQLFPEWLVKMFDMTELLSRVDFLLVEKCAFFIAAVFMAPVVVMRTRLLSFQMTAWASTRSQRAGQDRLQSSRAHSSSRRVSPMVGFGSPATSTSTSSRSACATRRRTSTGAQPSRC